MKHEWPEEIRRGLGDLAEEPVAGDHMTRSLAALRGRLEKREVMFRWTRRAGFAGAAFALLVFVMLFVPVSYDVCVGSVVEADWPKDDLIRAQAARMEAESRAREAALAEEEERLRAREHEMQERVAELEERTRSLRDDEESIQGPAYARLEESRARIEEHMERLRETLASIEGVVHSSIKNEDDLYRLQLFFAGKSAEEAERLTALQLAALPEELREPLLASKELRRKIGGNVLAWASGGRIVIHAEGATPEELEEKIEQEFLRLGAEHADATVKIDEDGVSIIDLDIGEMPADAFDGDSLTIEITR